MQSIAKRRATNITSWKASAIAAAIAVALCAAGPALAAKPQGKGGGGGGGGGGGHSSGGGAHFSGGGGAHFSGGGTHFAAPAHVTPRFSGSSSKSHVTSNVSSNSKVTSSVSPNSKVKPNVSSNSKVTNFTSNSKVTPNVKFARTHPAGGADPAAFLAHRHFAGGPAFRPFLGHGWHPYHHLGWVGPLFWPYAYGDVFYYALWPADYEYVDPFWAYGYGDIYESIFSPDSYDDYVQGPDAPARMASLTQKMAQSCDEEAAEVTGWPISQIQDAVQPDQQQASLLDNLGNAIVKASDEIRSHCPTSVSFTPTARLR